MYDAAVRVFKGAKGKAFTRKCFGKTTITRANKMLGLLILENEGDREAVIFMSVMELLKHRNVGERVAQAILCWQRDARIELAVSENTDGALAPKFRRLLRQFEMVCRSADVFDEYLDWRSMLSEAKGAVQTLETREGAANA